MRDIIEVDIEVTEEDINSLIPDKVQNKPEPLRNWLLGFKQTHYNGREFTDHFFTICHMGIKNGLDIRSILGDKIIEDILRKKPTEFEFYYSKPFNEICHRKVSLDFRTY